MPDWSDLEDGGADVGGVDEAAESGVELDRAAVAAIDSAKPVLLVTGMAGLVSDSAFYRAWNTNWCIARASRKRTSTLLGCTLTSTNPGSSSRNST